MEYGTFSTTNNSTDFPAHVSPHCLANICSNFQSYLCSNISSQWATFQSPIGETFPSSNLSADDETFFSSITKTKRSTDQ